MPGISETVFTRNFWVNIFFTMNFCNNSFKFFYGISFSPSYAENIIICVGVFQNKQIRVNHIMDIDKISFLETVFIKDGSFIKIIMEVKNSAGTGISIIKRLSGTLYNRIPESHRRNFIPLSERNSS